MSLKEESPKDGTRDFGFDEVGNDDHRRLVRDVFDRVAGRYDLMNDVMSGGLHRLWKASFIGEIAPRPGTRHLDLAGGTGDIAMGLHRAADGEAEIFLTDINTEMLGVAEDRLIDKGIFNGIAFSACDAAHLPFANRSFDTISIAFGLRNVTERTAALAEIRRVLKPGGRFYCLEFSRVVLPLLDRLYDLYSFNVVPMMGQAIAGDADSYRYLVESIRRFPDQAGLETEMAQAGLDRPTHRNMSGGIVALHSAWRL